MKKVARIASKVSDIKKAQKESALLREIASLFMQAALEDDRLKDFTITRVKLSPDKGLCTVYFYTAQGEDYFKQSLDILKLYKPSLRKALAERFASRYTPQLTFAFDASFEKQQRIEQLLEKVKGERPS